MKLGAAVVGLLVVAGGVWFSLTPAPAEAPSTPAQGTPATAPAPFAEGGSAALSVAAIQDHQASPQLLDGTVLAGTQWDGDWALSAQGELRPHISLRRRFDYLLQMQGQRPLEAITQLLRQRAEQALRADQAQTVMDLWQRYLRLQQAALPNSPSPHDPAALLAALQARQQARIAHLGPAWAYAFFADEEARLQQTLANELRDDASPPPLIDTRQLPPEALARLEKEQRRQARWEARLQQARQAFEHIRVAPHLSEAQKQEEITRLLSTYTDAERVRVAALLGLPTP